MNDGYTIRSARPEDAVCIGNAVVEAIGRHIAEMMAGDNHTVDDVRNMFALLAARDNTQYSYRNTLVAVDDDDRVVGVCIAYDGSLLRELRPRFIEAAGKMLDIKFGELEDECVPTEFYLDTLAVLPEYRGHGIASSLIRATVGRAAQSGKPAGLLVDKDNPRARRLYERMGFVKVDERPFVHVVMDHLQHPL